jgi:K+-transporting ATPase KdpF subunit
MGALPMSALYVIGALVALGLAVYLVWALFRPEDFS